MAVWKFIAALWKDWAARMTGIASLVLAVWGALFPPASIYVSRTQLLIAAVTCFLVASYRVWLKEHRELEKEQAKNAPVLVLNFNHNERSFREDGNFAGIGSYELYRVRVTNNGVRTVNNVKAAIVTIEPESLFRLPLYLRVMDKHSRNLAPDGEIFFEVVCLNRRKEYTSLDVCKDTDWPSSAALKMGRHILTIKVTGDDVKSTKKTFSVHVAGNRLYMHEDPQLDATARPKMSAQPPTHTLTE